MESTSEATSTDDLAMRMEADSANPFNDAPRSRHVSASIELPSIFKVNVELWDQPQLQGTRLQKIAEMASGLSGRTLRKLPTMALALHTYGDCCTVDEALEALSLEVSAHKLAA